MKVGFDSLEAAEINEKIFETIYYGALQTSMEIARKRTPLIKKIKELKYNLDNLDKILFDTDKIEAMRNEYNSLMKFMKLTEEEMNKDKFLGTYSSYEGSSMSKGSLQFDLWEQSPYGMYDWDGLKRSIKEYGVRNSLLLAPMPTASTSQILGNNECIEPYTSNIYIRRTLAGEFVVINKHLIKDLLDLGIYNEGLKNEIIRNNGSVQNIDIIPDNIKVIYKTVWEIGNKALINMAATRGKYICQSQSLNLFLDTPDFQKLSSMHFYHGVRD